MRLFSFDLAIVSSTLPIRRPIRRSPHPGAARDYPVVSYGEIQMAESEMCRQLCQGSLDRASVGDQEGISMVGWGRGSGH